MHGVEACAKSALIITAPTVMAFFLYPKNV